MEEIFDTQGRSKYTRDKEMAFAEIISDVFYASRSAIGRINIRHRNNYPFHFIDLFAGSGYNIPNDGGDPIEGTPLISSRNLDTFTRASIKINPFFVESNIASAEALRDNLTALGFQELVSRVWHGDAQEFLKNEFDKSAIRYENRGMAIGLLLVDPNILYRNEKRRTGIHVSELRNFILKHHRIDILMRIDTRFHRLAISHALNCEEAWLDQTMPIETLLKVYLKKQYWCVQSNGPRSLIVFGSNYLKRIQGMVSLDTSYGLELIWKAEGKKHRGWTHNPLIPGSLPRLPPEDYNLEEDEDEEYDPDWSVFSGHEPEEEKQ